MREEDPVMIFLRRTIIGLLVTTVAVATCNTFGVNNESVFMLGILCSVTYGFLGLR